jgi:hypothetical protein
MPPAAAVSVSTELQAPELTADTAAWRVHASLQTETRLPPDPPPGRGQELGDP